MHFNVIDGRKLASCK